MGDIIYFDNSATTKPCKTAIEYINKALNDNWGNPSSLHSLGLEAEISVNSARAAIANNTALMSVLNSRKKKIITTEIEHPSVLETAKRLSEQGFDVIKIGCNRDGVIDLKAFLNHLNQYCKKENPDWDAYRNKILNTQLIDLIAS